MCIYLSTWSNSYVFICLQYLIHMCLPAYMVCVSACLQALIIPYEPEIHKLLYFSLTFQITIFSRGFYISLIFSIGSAWNHHPSFFTPVLYVELYSGSFHMCLNIYICLLRHQDSPTAHTLLISTAWLTYKLT